MEKQLCHLRLLRRLLLTVAWLGCCISASADSHCDFTVNSIHYNFISGVENEVAVTYWDYESGSYGGFTNDYSGSVVVPPTVTYNSKTYKVTAVGSNAFVECSGLTSVSLPNTITSIGRFAFGSCSKLTTVSIPQSVSRIDYGAFRGCVSLYSVNIPTAVTVIAGAVFENCQSLTSIIIPENVTTIGATAFKGCSNLSSITIPDNIVSVGNDAFYGTSWLSNRPTGVVYVGKVVYKYAGTMPEGSNITLRDGTTEISSTAFSGCSGLETISIPEGVTTIGPSAFSNCTSLKAITIPKSVTSMGGDTSSSAFYGCSALKDVTILCPNIGTWWFREVEAIERVVIGDEVKTIGQSAFYFCKGITSITIPESVTNIYSDAFSMCTSLADVTIANSQISVASSAFLGTPWLNNQPDGLIYIGQVAYKYKGEMPKGTNIVIKEGTVEIAESAFSSCYDNMASVVIPTSVKTIGNSAFSGCSGLESITIPEGVDSIGHYAFQYCRGLLSASIPGSVTSIGSSVFSYCENMTSVVMSEGITEISASMFSNCKKLASVVVPASVKIIGNFAFGACSELTSIVIPESVTAIGNSSFSGCTSLTDVVISKGVKTIGSDAFRGCNGLTSITFPSTVSSIGDAAFADCSIETVIAKAKEPIAILSSVFSYYSNYHYYSYAALATLCVPAGSKAAYEAAGVWKDFKEIVEMEEESVNNSLFAADIDALVGTKVVLPIELTNEDEVKLCQFDLRLPEGVTVAVKSNNKLDVKMTERAENHNVTGSRLANGDYRFIISSLDNDSFTGNEGTLVEITLDVSETLEVGEYTVKVLNTELSVPVGNGNELRVVKTADTESTLTVKDYTPGDVNNDESVSVTDVGCTINYILEQVPSVFVFDAADMNGDKNISVTDVGMIINLILNEGAASRSWKETVVDAEIGTETDADAANSEVASANLSLQPTGEGYELLLENKDAFVSFQFDVELAEGACLNGVRLTGDGDDDHLMTYRKLGNGKWRVVCYSLSNSAFAADEAALLTLNTTGDIAVTDIRLTTTTLDELHPADLVGTTTGIADVERGIKISTEGRTLRIISDRDTSVQLFTLGGISRTLYIKQGVNRVDGLRAGIYMIGNQKVIVR